MDTKTVLVYHLRYLSDDERKELGARWMDSPLAQLLRNIRSDAELHDVARALVLGRYDHAATVTLSGLGDESALDTAYRLTNHIDNDWTVGAIATGASHRSTSVGDLMLYCGDVYIVAPFGFTMIGEGE